MRRPRPPSTSALTSQLICPLRFLGLQLRLVLGKKPPFH